MDVWWRLHETRTGTRERKAEFRKTLQSRHATVSSDVACNGARAGPQRTHYCAGRSTYVHRGSRDTLSTPPNLRDKSPLSCAMANNRLTTTLRAAHPLEAQLIDDLRACTPRRRQHRIRQLLLQGLNHQRPQADLTQSVGRTSERMRIEVHLHSQYPEDAPLIMALRNMHPHVIGEFLRDTLVAGLFSTVDIVLDASSTPTMNDAGSLPAAARPSGQPLPVAPSIWPGAAANVVSAKGTAARAARSVINEHPIRESSTDAGRPTVGDNVDEAPAMPANADEQQLPKPRSDLLSLLQ